MSYVAEAAGMKVGTGSTSGTGQGTTSGAGASPPGTDTLHYPTRVSLRMTQLILLRFCFPGSSLFRLKDASNFADVLKARRVTFICGTVKLPVEKS